jgi:hypothetical protein
MKFHNTSGKSAASSNPKSEMQNPPPGKEHGNDSELPTAHANVPCPGKDQLQFDYIASPPIPIEPLVTKKTLADHYGLSVRTVNYAMTLGLPKVQVGGRVRFRFSEVQPWFEKNGCRRFAAEGIKMAIQKSVAKQFHLHLSDQVQITVTKPTSPTTQKKKSV